MECPDVPLFTGPEVRAVSAALTALIVAVIGMVAAYIARTVRRWWNWER